MQAFQNAIHVQEGRPVIAAVLAVVRLVIGRGNEHPRGIPQPFHPGRVNEQIRKADHHGAGKGGRFVGAHECNTQNYGDQVGRDWTTAVGIPTDLY